MILVITLALAFAKGARIHNSLIEVQGWLAYFGMNVGIHVASLPVSLQVLDPLLEPLLQKAKFKAGNMIMSLGCNWPFSSYFQCYRVCLKFILGHLKYQFSKSTQ